MKIARFTTGSDPRYAIVQTEGGDQRADQRDGQGPARQQTEGTRTYLAVLSGDPLFAPTTPTGERIELGDGVRLLAPVIPRSKVVCVGLNYVNHIKEMGHDMPAAPVLFMKPNTAIVGPDDPIILPDWSDEVSYEVELAIVIGKLCKDVSEESARDYILGYTIANDVTARDAQRADGQWTRAKGFDSACPLGPWIDTDVDPEDLRITSTVNGDVRQDARTSDMLFGVDYLVSYISSAMTLLPGDVIITGTPAGVGVIDDGDVVECAIESIGYLRNPVLRRR